MLTKEQFMKYLAALLIVLGLGSPVLAYDNPWVAIIGVERFVEGCGEVLELDLEVDIDSPNGANVHVYIGNKRVHSDFIGQGHDFLDYDIETEDYVGDYDVRVVVCNQGSTTECSEDEIEDVADPEEMIKVQ